MCIFCKIFEHYKYLSDGLEFEGRIFFFFFFARLIFHYQVRSAQDFKVKQREHYRSITGSRVTTIQEAFLAVPIQGCSFDSVPASVPPFAG